MPLPGRLISGGQTGADLGGLRAGKILGIPTGGTMPYRFMTEAGPRPWMKMQYGMTEHPSVRYSERTKVNVAEATITLVFGKFASAGSDVTLRAVAGRPFAVNPDVATLQVLAARFDAQTVVNVAGNRESTNRGIEAYVVAVLVEAWGSLLPAGSTGPSRSPLALATRAAAAPYPKMLPALPVWEPKQR